MNRNKTLPPPLPTSSSKPVAREFPELGYEKVLSEIKDKCAPISITLYGKGKHKVVFLPEAWQELKQMIYFGRKHPVNTYEQQYQGMGHVFIDELQNITIVVSHFLYIYSATRNKTFATVSNGNNDSMLERLEKERDIYNQFEITCNQSEDGYVYDPFVKFSPSEVVLFGHTHPNLGAFFSPPDRASGYATKTLPAVTFVCDPIRKEMKAMVGLKEEDAQVCVCEYTYSEGDDVVKNNVADNKKERLSTEELVALIGANCNELLARGVKGKYFSNRSFGRNLHIKFKAKYRRNKRKLRKTYINKDSNEHTR